VLDRRNRLLHPPPEAIRGFRGVYDFDISQIEGDDIPDLDAVRPKVARR
jgi:hypothetical protein